MKFEFLYATKSWFDFSLFCIKTTLFYKFVKNNILVYFIIQYLYNLSISYLKLKIKNPFEYYLKIVPNLNINKIKDCHEFHIIFFLLKAYLFFFLSINFISVKTLNCKLFYIHFNRCYNWNHKFLKILSTYSSIETMRSQRKMETMTFAKREDRKRWNHHYPSDDMFLTVVEKNISSQRDL